MEFFLYLNSTGKQIIHDLISAKFHIHENIGLCKNIDVFGYVDTPNKFVICTKNIKKSGLNVKHYVSETVYHEAIHAVQFCNNFEPLFASTKTMPISSSNSFQEYAELYLLLVIAIL